NAYQQDELNIWDLQFEHRIETICRIITKDEITDLPLVQTAVKQALVYDLHGPRHKSNSTEDKHWTLELVGEQAGVKTYKYYDTASGGREIYNIYKVRDGVILEETSHDANDMASMVTRYSFPDNTLIRERLPRFTVAAYEFADNPSAHSRQSVEVISADDNQMTLRTKVFFDNALHSQHDTRYVHMKTGK
ncbi:MAG: hypothetical protein LBD48_11990, partial [Treponema sp.]|nr:hypothetical protein [Treponema sp.]